MFGDMGDRLSFARRAGMVNHPEAPGSEKDVPRGARAGDLAGGRTGTGQGLTVFGVGFEGLGIAQRISQVNLRDALRDEDDVPHAIVGGGPQGDVLADERLGNPDFVSFEREPAVLLHGAHEVVGAVFGLDETSGPGARAGSIALRRHGVIERL